MSYLKTTGSVLQKAKTKTCSLNMDRFFLIFTILLVTSISKAQNNSIFYGGNGGGNAVNCLISQVVLPIELVYFEGNCEEGKINFSWLTASERNSGFFTIEKSTDAFEWEAVTKISAAGNSSTELFYTMEHKVTAPGTYYFRLKQTDMDGTISYSEVISVNSCFENKFAVYPNPATEQTFISFSTEIVMGEIVIRNVLGQIMYRTTIQNATGVEMDLQDLAAGQYYILVYESETLKNSIKLIRS